MYLGQKKDFENLNRPLKSLEEIFTRPLMKIVS
jgi:hypothetical protein